MKYALPLLLLCAFGAHAETLVDKLSSDKIGELKNSVTVKPSEPAPEQKRIQQLTDTPAKPMDGISVKVLDMNVSKKSSVTVEYAPEVKNGDVIDNKEKTSVNYNLKF